MRRVGEQLGKWALERSSEEERDLFGRSAYNRFYYAAFLTARDLVIELDRKWASLKHKDLPGVVKGKVRAQLGQALARRRRHGEISDGEYRAMSKVLGEATSELSNMLETAKDVRASADYVPEAKVRFADDTFFLEGCSFEAARGWSDDAQHHCDTIRRFWREAGRAATT